MNRVAIVYLTSYGLSVLGNAVAAIALPLVVLATTGDALAAGVVAASVAVPAVLSGLFMGGLIDRFDRRRMSVVTDLVSAGAIAAIPLVDLHGELSLGWFVLLGVVSSFGDVPGLTARETLVPGVQRLSGLSFDRLVGSREGVGAVAMMMGPAAAGFLVVLLDGSGALWVTAGLALAAALTTLMLPRDLAPRAVQASPGSARRAAGDVVAGIVWLARRSPLVLSVTLVNLALVTALAALQGLVLPVHFTLLGQQDRLGLVLSCLAAGMLVGSATYAAVSARLHRRTWLRLSLVGSLLGLAVVGTLPGTAVILVGAAVLGLFMGVLGALVGVVTVETIPDDLRGRVMGAQNALLTGAPGLGVLGAAMLVETTSPGTAAAVVVGVWCAAVLVALVVRPLRRLPSVPQEP